LPKGITAIFSAAHTLFSQIENGGAKLPVVGVQGSGWYAEGGAQKVSHHHKLLLLSPGVDRCGTVGFRCVKSDHPTTQGLFE
jgi:hypothetical protein